ncbi:GPW/gp25 family protein [Brucella sp.]|uniref:GPW/gp25 family protein n=1 Tax=Brucella sp. TaxID=52132 RepID=UPI0028A7E506|nr:hypothetical protein [Brucella sp.]
MPGMSADTGLVLGGYDHVEQSLAKIITTRLGERWMHEWFGNPGLRLLGQNANEPNVLLWINTIWMLVDLYEPRFKIERFDLDGIHRDGLGEFSMFGQYRPFAHLDWTQAKAFVSVSGGTVRLSLAD